jgi:hypothetical protein
MATRATRKTGWVTLVGVLFLIGGVFNVIWGLAGVGVGLGGTDSTVLGDTDVGNIVFLGIIGMAIGGLSSSPRSGSSAACRARACWASCWRSPPCW